MSIQHTSRTGKEYFLHVAPGKGGKPKFHFSTKPEGTLPDSIPEGFEIYENVEGKVFLRRKTPQLFTAVELASVTQALKNHAEEWLYKMEVKKDAIVIHEADDKRSALTSIAMPWVNKATIRDSAIKTATYLPAMRFVLVDRKKRLLCPQRFCFRGSVDDWIDIGNCQSLPALLRKFIKHLGKESFFDLC